MSMKWKLSEKAQRTAPQSAVLFGLSLCSIGHNEDRSGSHVAAGKWTPNCKNQDGRRN